MYYSYCLRTHCHLCLLVDRYRYSNLHHGFATRYLNLRCSLCFDPQSTCRLTDPWIVFIDNSLFAELTNVTPAKSFDLNRFVFNCDPDEESTATPMLFPNIRLSSIATY